MGRRENAQRARASRAPEQPHDRRRRRPAKPWRDSNDAEIAWTTFDTDPLQDRLFREASLDRTDFGVGFLVNSRATPNVAPLLQPLDDYRAKTPIEEFGDIAPGLVSAMTIGGKLIAVPFRTATIGLFYNEALLEERGIKAPPATLEELVDQAKQLTFRSQAGTPVVGMVVASDLATFPVSFARAYGGDFIGPDLKLVPDPAAMEKALATLADLYKAGALPRTLRHHVERRPGDVAAAGPRGVHRAAVRALRTAQSPGPIEISGPHQGGRVSDLVRTKGKVPMASCVEFWAMCIPNNARDKDLAWSFIQTMSSKAVTLGAARNGNGPGAHVDVQRSEFRGGPAHGRGRSESAGERAGSIAGVSQRGAGAGDVPRGDAARGARPQDAEGSGRRDRGADHAVDDRLNGTEQVGRAS